MSRLDKKIARLRFLLTDAVRKTHSYREMARAAAEVERRNCYGNLANTYEALARSHITELGALEDEKANIALGRTPKK